MHPHLIKFILVVSLFGTGSALAFFDDTDGRYTDVDRSVNVNDRR